MPPFGKTTSLTLSNTVYRVVVLAPVSFTVWVRFPSPSYVPDRSLPSGFITLVTHPSGEYSIVVTFPTGSITSVTRPRTSLVTDDLLPAGSVDATGRPALSHSILRTNPLGVIVAFGTIPVTRQSYSNRVTTPNGSVTAVTMPAGSTSYSVISPSLPVIWAGSPHAPGVTTISVPSP